MRMSTTPTLTPRTGARLALHLSAAVLTAMGLSAVMVLAYALAPVPTEAWTLTQFLIFSGICLVVFTTASLMAIYRLTRTKRPLTIGLAFAAIMATILILSYAWLYLTLSMSNADNFTESLTKASAIYFTVTVLSTVGFGDITPVGDTARLLVTSQMLLGFTLITFAIRAVMSTTTAAVKKKGASRWQETHAEETVAADQSKVAKDTAQLAEAEKNLADDSQGDS